MQSYLIESIDSLSLETERKKIIKDNKFTEATISSYDLEENTLESALEDLDTYSFLSTKKVVIIKNIEILKYDENKKYLDHLFKYIDNPSSDNLLIIEAKKLNNTTKVAKELKKKCNYIAVELDPKKIIKQNLKGYDISKETIELLESYCKGDITKISSECEKLKIYKIDEKEITSDDVKEIVMKKLGDPKDLTFAFTRSLAERDRKNALKQYKELLNYNIEPISIVGLLASQIRIIYQVKILATRNLRDKEIANILEEKSDYRITKTRELIGYYTEEELLKLMQTLSDMDLKLKTSETDANQLLEFFIMNI